MKIATTVLLFLAATTVAPAYAVTDAEAELLYVRAMSAIDKGDCAAGSVLLRKYKAAAAATLTTKPYFTAKIDQQIEQCDEIVLIDKPHSGTIFVGRGKIAADAKGLDQQQRSKGVQGK